MRLSFKYRDFTPLRMFGGLFRVCLVFVVFLSLNEVASAQTVRCLNHSTDLRTEPSLFGSTVMSRLPAAQTLEVVGFQGEWAKVAVGKQEGYVLRSYLGECTNAETVTVLVCKSEGAYAYHSHHCQGLNQCKHEIVSVSVSEAKRMNRRACGYCY